MRQRAWLAWRLPERLSRWRWILPDDAWIGSARQSSDANLLSASRASLAAASGGGAKTPE